MGSGKSSSQNQQSDIYGHCAGIVCQGQLDFIWGFMVNNVLVWLPATLWDAQIWQAGMYIIWTDGNVYNMLESANADPPNAPWALVASPWSAGAYLAGNQVLRSGVLWQASVNTSSAPPTVAPGNTISLQNLQFAGDWKYVVTPQNWATVSANIFWSADSIVAWEGRLYITPADTNAQPPNAPWVLWKQDLAGTNPLKFTVPVNSTQFGNTGGDVYLYTGQPNQVLDTVNEQILNALGHPPYRNRAVIVLKNYLFGTMQTSPPNCVVLGGRKPVQNLILGDATAFDNDWQVNPWCVLAEMLTHPIIGLGLPVSLFDQNAWQIEADRCAANPELFYISPIYTSLQKVRELAADLLGYPDAFVFWSILGQISAGHWPHHEAAPVWDNTNTINRDSLIEEMQWDSDNFDGTSNAVQVSFDDIQAAFNSRPISIPNLYNRAITQQLTSINLDRKFIVRIAQATAWGAEFAKILGDESINGELNCQSEKVAAILPGKSFLLTDDQLDVSLPQRCTKRVIAATPVGATKITHESERGLSPVPYSPTPTSPAQTNDLRPSAITNFILAQIPSALGTGNNELMCLAARDNKYTTAMGIYFRNLDTSAYQLLGTQNGFSIASLFNGDSNTLVSQTDNFLAVTNGNAYNLTYGDIWKAVVTYQLNGSGAFVAAASGTDYVVDRTAGVITILMGGSITTTSNVRVVYPYAVQLLFSPDTPDTDIESVSNSLTEDEIADNEIIIFAFQAANPKLYEIFSVKSVVAVGGGVYNIQVKRQQYGTLFGGDGAHDFTTSDFAFVCVRDNLIPLQHALFDSLAQTDGTADFILTASNSWTVADINDLYDASINPNGLATQASYTFDNPFAPIGMFGVLLKNGAALIDFSAAILTTDALSFNFSMTDADGNLSWASLTAAMGSTEINLWSQNYQPNYAANATVNFSFPSAGTWNIFLNLLDNSGNSVKFPLTLSGVSNITVQNPAVVQCPSPPIASYAIVGVGSDYLRVLGSIVFGNIGTGYTVKYQVQPVGTNYNPAAWITTTPDGTGLYKCASNFTFTTSGSNALYAIATKLATTDSVVVSWIYFRQFPH